MKWLFLPLCLFFSNAFALDVYPAQPVGIRIKLTDTSEMATVTKTVAASGADYTTVADALGWFQSNHDFDTDGIARIQITDTTSYTQSSTLTLNGIAGTPTISAYLEITSNASNPFDGPIINCTHSSSGCYHIDLEFTYIHNLTFHLNTTSNSAECIRMLTGSSDDSLISRNAFIALTQSNNQDGIYLQGAYSNIRMDNNFFVGFQRGAIHLQNNSGSDNASIDVRFTSIASDGTDSVDGGGIVLWETDGVTTATVYNTLIYNRVGNQDLYRDAKNSPVWVGSNNIAEDATAESKFTGSYDSVTFTETSPGSGENAWLVEIDTATEIDIDLSIAGENAYTVTGNGIDQVGSEPDARQDFSIDIMGNARHASTPDIGAFEYDDGGVAFRPKFSPLHGPLSGPFGGPL